MMIVELDPGRATMTANYGNCVFQYIIMTTLHSIAGQHYNHMVCHIIFSNANSTSKLYLNHELWGGGGGAYCITSKLVSSQYAKLQQ